MKAILYYFTGTGNTEMVAKMHRNCFEQNGCQTDLYRICQPGKEPYSDIPDPNSYDIIGIGFPIYGFNSPEPAYKFARLLPSIAGQKKPTFIFKTSGEGLPINRYAGQKIIHCMEKKGYDFLMERHIVMPYNMVFRHSAEMVKSEYHYALAMSELNVRDVLCGKHEKVRYCPLSYWFVPLVRIVWPYGRFQGKFVMHVRKDKCIGCGLCEKLCPMGNVKMVDGFPKFGSGECALCVACVFNCPSSAISVAILNGMVQHGSYNIEKTAGDEAIANDAFGENLRGLKRWAYYRYYRNWDKKLKDAGIEVFK